MSALDKKTKTISETVKSLRLDAIIAAAYNISRGDAQKLVESQMVKVNYRELTSVSMSIEAGDLVSVRGKGRFILSDIEGQTRKERIRINIKLFIS